MKKFCPLKCTMCNSVGLPKIGDLYDTKSINNQIFILI